MPRKRYKPEQIVNLLGKIEVEIGHGKTTPQAAREVGSHRTDVLPVAKGVRRAEAGPSEAIEGTGEREQAVGRLAQSAVLHSRDETEIGRARQRRPVLKFCANQRYTPRS